MGGHETPIGDLVWACVDVETTGLKPSEGHRICEVAVARGPRSEVTDRWSTLVNPERPLDPSAAAVNRLTDAELAAAPVWSAVEPQVRALLANAVLVAHNSEFDLGFLEADLRRCGGEPLANLVVDTVWLARAQFRFGSNSLGALVSSLELPPTAEHRALGDALATRAVLLALLDRLPDIRTLGDLLVAQTPSFEWLLADRALAPLLTESLRTGCRLHLVYEGREGRSERIITPQRIAVQRGRGQLRAFCHQRGEQRSFRLDRIVHLEPA